MSTIKVNKIENTSTTDGGISIDNSGHVTVDGQQLPTAGPLSNRNMFENGAMAVAQRGASTTGITSAINLNVDRFILSLLSLGTWTSSQEADGPTGFAKSLKINCTTADASPGASDYAILTTRLEGQNLQVLEYGTSNAKDITISFYVKSNKTGDASFELVQTDNNDKHYSVSYNISAENTWEPITITIPGDTAGQIDDDIGIGFQLFWWLNSGSAYSGGSASNAWQTLDSTDRNPNNIGIGGAVNDYFQITGLQVEIGEKATPFEHLNFGDYLQRCQRYFYSLSGSHYGAVYGTGGSMVTFAFPVEMRAAPATTFTHVNGTLSTNFTTRQKFQQYVTGATNVRVHTMTASAEL